MIELALTDSLMPTEYSLVLHNKQVLNEILLNQNKSLPQRKWHKSKYP